jgi:hypothetical protein
MEAELSMAGEDLLETPGEGEMSGEARFFIHPGSHKNGGMARVSAPLWCYHHWTTTLG